MLNIIVSLVLTIIVLAVVYGLGLLLSTFPFLLVIIGFCLMWFLVYCVYTALYVERGRNN